MLITVVENESNMSLITTPNSGNTYYFRSRIPTDLIEHFGGCLRGNINSGYRKEI